MKKRFFDWFGSLVPVRRSVHLLEINMRDSRLALLNGRVVALEAGIMDPHLRRVVSVVSEGTHVNGKGELVRITVEVPAHVMRQPILRREVATQIGQHVTRHLVGQAEQRKL